jgi:hypothetical protein
MKECGKCRQVLDIEEFALSKKSHLGRCSICKKCRNAQAVEYRQLNKEKVALSKKLSRLKHIDSHRERKNNYNRLKYKTDMNFKMKIVCRGIVRRFLKFKGTQHTEEIIGCSYKEFKEYIESKFEPWMTWENYGKYNGELDYGWDIDHIIPISYAGNNDDYLRLNHYTNLQPLCSKVNRDIKNGGNGRILL